MNFKTSEKMSSTTEFPFQSGCSMCQASQDYSQLMTGGARKIKRSAKRVGKMSGKKSASKKSTKRTKKSSKKRSMKKRGGAANNNDNVGISWSTATGGRNRRQQRRNRRRQDGGAETEGATGMAPNFYDAGSNYPQQSWTMSEPQVYGSYLEKSFPNTNLYASPDATGQQTGGKKKRTSKKSKKITKKSTKGSKKRSMKRGGSIEDHEMMFNELLDEMNSNLNESQFYEKCEHALSFLEAMQSINEFRLDTGLLYRNLVYTIDEYTSIRHIRSDRINAIRNKAEEQSQILGKELSEKMNRNREEAVTAAYKDAEERMKRAREEAPNYVYNSRYHGGRKRNQRRQRGGDSVPDMSGKITNAIGKFGQGIQGLADRVSSFKLGGGKKRRVARKSTKKATKKSTKSTKSKKSTKRSRKMRGGGSDWMSTFYSRGAVNTNTPNDKALFTQFADASEYISKYDLLHPDTSLATGDNMKTVRPYDGIANGYEAIGGAKKRRSVKKVTKKSKKSKKITKKSRKMRGGDENNNNNNNNREDDEDNENQDGGAKKRRMARKSTKKVAKKRTALKKKKTVKKTVKKMMKKKYGGAKKTKKSAKRSKKSTKKSGKRSKRGGSAVTDLLLPAGVAAGVATLGLYGLKKYSEGRGSSGEKSGRRTKRRSGKKSGKKSRRSRNMNK
jgi:hypothetical protein